MALYGVAELVVIETGADIGQRLDNAFIRPIRRSRMAAESSKGVVICGGIRCACMVILLSVSWFHKTIMFTMLCKSGVILVR